MVSFLVTWILLAGFWVALSGYTDVIHMTFGAVSVTLVSLLSHRHLIGKASLRQVVGRLLRSILYSPWLLWQIVLANVDVIRCVLGFKPIAPRVIRFRPDLNSEYGMATLANSITLTPGTVTIDVTEDGEFIVHALTPEAAEAVLSLDMTQRVHWLEGE